ncbi:class I SAM-dependent methyltransferase [Geobacter sp. DSM 9736]|uniref:class I SAM-dependent methyltransferase n=1 Tax=Geobacter sp. DSM 9736 TaxID=1277350 RepID=UPI000B60A2A0|nr:class I SAM-dependent methyltransferase [Geobacter sp. DSM 9736]SNB46622.1 Methyltransferase domain-containing protein [Geobacter sp. DSM 9736]
MQITTCYNCFSKNRSFYAEENGHSLVKCGKCGLLYLKERPDDTEISQAHKQGKHSGLVELDVTGQFTDSKVPNYLKVLKDIYQYDFRNNVKWLDIGCGHGEFMTALQHYATGTIIVTGSEPNVQKQQSARKRGLDVSYFDIETHTGTYDVISLLNVYSHLPNPLKFIESLKRCLNKDGEIIIETGDTADLQAKHHYRPFYLPDHLSFASEKIVTDILVRLGFKIISINKYPYPNSQRFQSRCIFVKELMKAVLPHRDTKFTGIFRSYLNQKLWSKTDMYIRARLIQP